MLNIFVENIEDKNVQKLVKMLRDYSRSNIKFFFPENIKKEIRLLPKDSLFVSCATNGVFAFSLEFGSVSSISDCYVNLSKRKDIDNFVLLKDNTISCYKGDLIFYLDAKHNSDLPDKFYKLPVFDSFTELKNYGLRQGKLKFNFKDKAVFEPTGRNNKSKPIYREIATGNLWYEDDFHNKQMNRNPHYEVFDPTGQTHIGEASIDGILDENKADPNKKPIL